MRRSFHRLAALTFVLCALRLDAADSVPGGLNQPERLEWFRDQGFGLFIHWSVDSQLGAVISHSVVGASDDYAQRFFTELPKTFNPRKFHPQDWAALARLAGIRYVVLTAKHHSGFCLWPTATTDFDVAHSPFKRDIVAEVLTAFREQGIAPGLYFSPEDFSWLHGNHLLIERRRPAVFPENNPGLMALDQAQISELLTRYGPIDVMFFDGPPEGLRETAWKTQPSLVVTRGAILTPEQFVPGAAIDEAWEACLTMGKAWQYQPTLENYKSGGECLSLLIETRAKGGNLLLNVGPKPDGELPIEQEERLREIALWMFVNRECIYGVRPWVVTNEGEVWFTKHKNSDTLYAIVKSKEPWRLGVWRDVVLKSVRVTPQTEISVLGQNDRAVEYQLDVVPKTTWEQKSGGVHVRAMRAQRLDDKRTWPNPVVLKLTHVQPALTPPRIETLSTRWDDAKNVLVLSGNLRSLGDSTALEVGFEYRDTTGLDTHEGGLWTSAAPVTRTTPGEFTIEVTGLTPGAAYEARAIAKHPLLTTYGAAMKISQP